MVDNINNQRINELDGREFELKAIVFSETRGTFVPNLDNKGDIRGTTLQYNLKLKKKSRIIILMYAMD